jgi:hypothetical protein
MNGFKGLVTEVVLGALGIGVGLDFGDAKCPK